MSVNEIISEIENKKNSASSLEERIDLINQKAYYCRLIDKELSCRLNREALELSTTGPFSEAPYARGKGNSLAALSKMHLLEGKTLKALDESREA